MENTLDPSLYEICIHGRKISEIVIDRLWCADIQELIINKQPCPISLEIINKLDQIALDRIKEIRGNKLMMQVYE